MRMSSVNTCMRAYMLICEYILLNVKCDWIECVYVDITHKFLYMYIIYIYESFNMYVCMRGNDFIYIYVFGQVRMWMSYVAVGLTKKFTCIKVYMHVRMLTQIFLCKCRHWRIYVGCIYVCIYVYLYFYLHASLYLLAFAWLRQHILVMSFGAHAYKKLSILELENTELGIS